jgi:NTP pyrophosphatase (non-canonical NTP hydrolase)
MGKDGGTQLWCPNCESIQVCRVDASYPETDENRGNIFWHQVPKINSFRRPRVCNKCEGFFWTDELNEEWIEKLIDYERLSDAYSLEGLQKEIAAFSTEREWEQFHTIKNLVLALVGEVGELAEIVQWKSDLEIQREIEKTPEEKLLDAILETESLANRMEEELADIFIYLLRISTITNIDLIAAVKAKMELNAKRYTVEKSKGNSEKQ